MTETGSTMERLNAELNYDGSDHWETVVVEAADVRALLAVVEAAQDVRENSKQAIGIEDPWGSQGPPILVSASIWFELADKLEALHSQASDEGRE